MKIYKDLQQGTEEWVKVKKGVISGTKSKGVTGGPKAQLTEMYSLLAEQYIDEPDMLAWQIIERGNELEPIAKATYEEITGQKVEEVGFIKESEWLGLSPDGIISKYKDVKNDSEYTKAIEIKCPRGKNYIKYLLENKIPDEYIGQVVHYFIVMKDLEELDFIIYNPDVSDKIPNIHIINVKREDLQKNIDKALDKITIFRDKWIEREEQLLTFKLGTYENNTIIPKGMRKSSEGKIYS